MFQASGIWGLVDPMTGPELIDWAKFNNMQYRETPRVFPDFKVQRVDLEPLTTAQITAFRTCVWVRTVPGEATPEEASEWGKTLAVLSSIQTSRKQHVAD